MTLSSPKIVLTNRVYSPLSLRLTDGNVMVTVPLPRTGATDSVPLSTDKTRSDAVGAGLPVMSIVISILTPSVTVLTCSPFRVRVGGTGERIRQMPRQTCKLYVYC